MSAGRRDDRGRRLVTALAIRYGMGLGNSRRLQANAMALPPPFAVSACGRRDDGQGPGIHIQDDFPLCREKLLNR